MTVQATDPRSGWFRFLHHDVPVEWTDNVDERLEYIRAEKPTDEVTGRLAAIVRIPDEVVPSALHEAQRAHVEAQRAYDEVQRVYGEALRAHQARRAHVEALRAYGETLAYGEACEAQRARLEAQRAHVEAQRAYGEAQRAHGVAQWAYDEALRAYGEALRADDVVSIALQFDPLPVGVTWNGEELVFAP